MTKAPCKDCPQRKVGCHSACEKYQGWLKIHDQELEVIQKAKEENGMFAEHIIRSVRRVERRKWDDR